MKCYRFDVLQDTVLDANNRIIQSGFCAELVEDELEEDHPVQQLLDRYGTDSFFFLSNLVNAFYQKSGIIPWCIILLEKEYAIGEHIDSTRKMKSDILYSAWSYRFKGERFSKEVLPLASVIIIKDKDVLFDAATKSELFKMWLKGLADQPEHCHWVCIAPSVPEDLEN